VALLRKKWGSQWRRGRFKYGSGFALGMVKLKIEYDRSGCIGASVCMAIAPERWELDDEAKAVLKGSASVGSENFELIVDVPDSDALLQEVEAAKGCPTKVIKITNVETGERLV
jgi:ferredoxin